MFFGDDDDNGVPHAFLPPGNNSSVVTAAAAGAAYFKATGQGQTEGRGQSGPGDADAWDALISSCYHTGYSSQAFRYITAFCFLFLAATTATLGGKVSLASAAVMLHFIPNVSLILPIIAPFFRVQLSQKASFRGPSSRYLGPPLDELSRVNIFLFASFFSRGLYETLEVLGVVQLPDIPLQVGMHSGCTWSM